MDENKRNPVPSKIYSKNYFLTGCLGSGVYKRSKGRRLDRRLQRCMEIADLKKNMNVLDIGCGRGEVSFNAALIGCKVFAIDYSNAALDLTKQTINKLDKGLRNNVVIRKMDATDIGNAFNNATFDRILMFDIVEHLYDWQLTKLLDSIKKILKPDGKLIIHTSPNKWVYEYAYFLKRLYMLIKKGKLLLKDSRSPHDKKMHVNEQNIISLKKLLKDFDKKMWVEFVTTPKHRYKIVELIEKSPLFYTPIKYFLCNDIFAVCTKK